MEKERRTKALVIVVLLIVVAGLTVAFAALSTTLNINGTAYLDAAKWGIRFENLSSPTKIGSATTTGTAKIEETKAAEITDMNVNLMAPGDKVTYTVDLVNKGTINAKIDNIEKTVLTSEQQRYLTFKVTDKDGKEVSKYDILSAGETRKLTITIEFIKDLTKEDLPKQTSAISLSYKLNFVQTDEKLTSAGQSGEQACTSFDKKDTYNVGDVIALCNADTGKSEDFYVISDNGDTVTALAKYNLLVGNTMVLDVDTGDTELTPIPTTEEEYGLQSIKTYYEIDEKTGMPTSNSIGGIIAFANNNGVGGYWADSNGNPLSKYGTSYPVYVFDENSLLYEPLKNYESYIKTTIGKTSVNTSLITFDQLNSLGCSDSSCNNASNWVYETSYWLGYANYSYFVKLVSIDGSIGMEHYDDVISGLRPVITISKSDI